MYDSFSGLDHVNPPLKAPHFQIITSFILLHQSILVSNMLKRVQTQASPGPALTKASATIPDQRIPPVQVLLLNFAQQSAGLS